MNKKVILITGSSRGIGANLVENFSKNNFNVVINYSNSDNEAQALYQKVLPTCGFDSILSIKADVSDRDQVNRMFDQIYNKFNACDILVNNAGINKDKPFLEMTLGEWKSVIDTILTGTFNCSQEFSKRYQGDSGHIVNIGALTGISGRKNGVNYCAARAGIINMTHCLALELAPTIVVNTVTPGCINTEEVMTRHSLHVKENYDKKISLIPSGRLGTPEDIFNAVYSLVTNMTYVNGQNLIIDGGYLMR